MAAALAQPDVGPELVLGHRCGAVPFLETLAPERAEAHAGHGLAVIRVDQRFDQLRQLIDIDTLAVGDAQLDRPVHPAAQKNVEAVPRAPLATYSDTLQADVAEVR